MTRYLCRAFMTAVLTASSALAMQGCGDSSNDLLVKGILLGDAGGMYAAATVEQDGEEIDGAEVAVNSTPLAWGLPIEFESEGGIPVSETVHIYYADMTGLVTPGEKASITARSTTKGLAYYYSGEVAVPGLVTLAEPAEGSTFGSDEDVAMSWSAVVDAQGYAASYSETNAFDGDPMEEEDDEGDEEDAGLYLKFVRAGTLSATVPASSTIAGEAEFSVTAVNTNRDILDEDYDGSIFVTGTYDSAAATIADGAAAQIIADKQLAGSQGLAVAREYTKKIEGYNFKVRETDPQQITAPGTLQLGFEMRRFKASIAFVKAYDMNGAEYFSWTEKRIFKSSKKKYYPSFAAKAGTTVVFGTHDASYRGGTYTY